MMNITLLAAQAALADTLAGGNPVLTPVSEEARMNLWDMAMKGGWIMLVLALLSVVCFYIFFERMAVIRKAGKDDPLFMERIRDYIRTGEIKSAINYCRITNTPSARMIEKGITRHDLSLVNLKYMHTHIPWLDEVSIGHALISDALYMGLKQTIEEYKNCLRS